MAESFVTVVVAFPLFLVVIMAIMAIVPGGGGNSSITVLLLEARRRPDDPDFPVRVHILHLELDQGVIDLRW